MTARVARPSPPSPSIVTYGRYGIKRLKDDRYGTWAGRRMGPRNVEMLESFPRIHAATPDQDTGFARVGRAHRSIADNFP